MRFWDSSALVPLLVADIETERLADLVREDPAVVAWWGTPIECQSAVARLERERKLAAPAAQAAFGLLKDAARGWIEVPPTKAVRDRALRLLRVHPLRSGDALQLGAALVAADDQPEQLEFVSLDGRLRGAAEKEGFVLR